MKKYFFPSVGIIVLAALILLLMGRVLFCKCDVINFWSSDTKSNEQSQQFTDPYSFTHVIHGMLFYLLLWLILGKRLSWKARLVIAVGLESGWEILENTNFILDRYRAETVSYGYYGDSVLNSMGDILAMVLGFWLAAKLPVKLTVFTALLIDFSLLYFIHDSLLVNIIMLIHPIDAIKQWQMTGS